MHPTPNIVKGIKSITLRWAGHVTIMEDGRSAFKILKGKPTGKRPSGRSRRSWKDNMRMDLKEIDETNSPVVTLNTIGHR